MFIDINIGKVKVQIGGCYIVEDVILGNNLVVNIFCDFGFMMKFVIDYGLVFEYLKYFIGKIIIDVLYNYEGIFIFVGNWDN